MEEHQKTIGIVGGGQLGRMLCEAAHKLGFRVVILDPTPGSPAGLVADDQIIGDFKDKKAVHLLADSADVITFEIESANAEALEEISKERPQCVEPLPQTLAIIKDKLAQKTFLQQGGIPVAPFRAIADIGDIYAAAESFGYPLILKARRGGYDGRGNARIENQSGIAPALLKLSGSDLYSEQNIPFSKELAVVGMRTRTGEIATYPAFETVHKNHICHLVVAPAPIAKPLSKKAEELARRVLSLFSGAGVFAIEMFLTAEGTVLVNEIAPRVHNSGHLTIEGFETSQFEQHIRAIMGMPLGPMGMRSPAAAMINILGDREGAAEAVGLKEALALGNTAVHIYGKKETKPERKMGHITTLAETASDAIAKAHAARSCVSI